MLSITKIDVVSLVFLKLTALALILHLNLADILLTSIYIFDEYLFRNFNTSIDYVPFRSSIS